MKLATIIMYGRSSTCMIQILASRKTPTLQTTEHISKPGQLARRTPHVPLPGSNALAYSSKTPAISKTYSRERRAHTTRRHGVAKRNGWHGISISKLIHGAGFRDHRLSVLCGDSSIACDMHANYSYRCLGRYLFFTSNALKFTTSFLPLYILYHSLSKSVIFTPFPRPLFIFSLLFLKKQSFHSMLK